MEIAEIIELAKIILVFFAAMVVCILVDRLIKRRK